MRRPGAARGREAVGIVGNYGHHNAGDEAILWGVVSTVRQAWPGAEVVIFSDDLPDTRRRFPGCTVLPLIVPGRSRLTRVARTVVHAWRALRRLDLLVVGGGGLLVDSYPRTPRLLATLMAIARLAGARLACYQVGAGPITTPAGRRLFRLCAEMAHAVSVRDAESAQVLRQLGVHREVLVQADPALLLEPAAARDAPLPAPAGRLRVGIAPVPYCAPGLWYQADGDRFDQYTATLAALADHAVAAWRAVPVFFRFAPGDDVAARAIQGKMQRAAEALILAEERDPQELLGLVGQMDLFVGTRLHSAILSTLAGVPTLALAYQEKVRNYMRSVGQGERVLDVGALSAPELIGRFEALVREQAEVRASLERSVPPLQDRARQGIAVLRAAGRGGRR